MPEGLPTFQLQVLSINGVFFEGEARILTLPLEDGLMQILAHHEQIFVGIADGIMVIEDASGNTHEAVVSYGSCRFAGNACLVLADTIERPEDIDIERAKAALEIAKEHMRQSQSIREYHLSQLAMARALTRIKASMGKTPSNDRNDLR